MIKMKTEASLPPHPESQWCHQGIFPLLEVFRLRLGEQGKARWLLRCASPSGPVSRDPADTAEAAGRHYRCPALPSQGLLPVFFSTRGEMRQ